MLSAVYVPSWARPAATANAAGSPPAFVAPSPEEHTPLQRDEARESLARALHERAGAGPS
jgi:hypothetical protein